MLMCVWFLANDQETIAGSVLVSVVVAPLYLAETSLSADVPDLGEMMSSRELGRQEGVCNISLCRGHADCLAQSSKASQLLPSRPQDLALPDLALGIIFS